MTSRGISSVNCHRKITLVLTMQNVIMPILNLRFCWKHQIYTWYHGIQVLCISNFYRRRLNRFQWQIEWIVFKHYDDVIMTMLASQITSLTVVYSIVYSGVNQRKHQTPRHWPLCGKFTGDRWISRTNGQLREKCFHLMTSSWQGGQGTLI